MYDPNQPPEWLRGQAVDAELEARSRLRALFQAIDREPLGDACYKLWDQARDAEDTLEQMMRRRAALADAESDDSEESLEELEL